MKLFGAKIKQATVLPVCALRFADFLRLCYHLERLYAQSAFLFSIVFIFSPMITLIHFFDFGSALGRSPSFRHAPVVPLCGHTYRFGLRHTAPPVQMRIMKELSVNFNQIGFSTSKITLCRKNSEVLSIGCHFALPHTPQPCSSFSVVESVLTLEVSLQIWLPDCASRGEEASVTS